ncbi:MAG: sulfite exporter TauE/SafE family protein [Anaerolineales bacterium]
MFFLQVALGLAIGFSLGLLGGGGSILTVPALVYLIGQSPNTAIATSLAIVSANSATGAIFHHSQGTLNWKVALIFGGAGIGTAYLSAGLSNLISPTAILIIFALLMVAVTSTLLLQQDKEKAFIKPKPVLFIVISGVIVGILTGLLGVGGGFLIVPALTILVGLPMQTAVGTSLVIIAVNSLAGFLGHIGIVSLDLQLTLTFVLAGLIGSFFGAKLSNRISSLFLQKTFAVFVIALAFFLLYDNLIKLL